MTRLKYPGSDQHPGGLNISLSTPLSHLETTLVKCQKITADDDMLLLSAAVSRARPGGSETLRMPSSRTEGLSKQDVKAEEVPVPASGDTANIADDILLLLSGDNGDQRPLDVPESGSDAEAASGDRSSANRGTPDGSPAAPPPPAPAATSSSLSGAVWEVPRRAATSTRKRKQPETGEVGGPSYAGREHLRRAAQSNKGKTTATNLVVNEESQTRQQKNSTRDTTGQARNRCECGSCHHPSFGLPGTIGRKAARWCSQCPSKPHIAVDVMHKRCECGRRQPTFGLPGTIGKKAAARWCSQCPSKPHNAVDVVSKWCECGSCHPTFGLPGTIGRKAARWCSQCPSKPHNAVDVVHKRCECGSCHPSFGLPGVGGMKGTRRWCSQCPSKPSNAVDVVKNNK